MVRPARRGARASVLVLAAWLTAPSLSFPSSRARPSDAPVPEWREGPARYIITKGEDDEYIRSKTEEERRRFIEVFWRRRDPTPETPGNEYRASFWKRVREATSLYGRETSRPGWLTDMGKIHILLGAPDEIARDEMAEGHRGIVVWTYRSSPNIGGISTGAGPNQVIAFAQDDSGEYRMTVEPTKLANVWEGLPDPQPPAGPMKFVEARRKALQKAYMRYIGLTDPVIRAAGGPALESPLGLTMLLARLQQPPKEWTLRGEVTTREYFGTLPFRARADFFKVAGGNIRVLLTVGVRSRSATYRSTPQGDRPWLQVHARILDSTASESVLIMERGGPFAAAPGNDSAGLDDDLIFQARAALTPGSYVARLTVLDDVSGRSGTADTPFTVPDFNVEGLELSSVVLARTLEPVAAGASAEAPFHLGRLRVVPRLGQEFIGGEDLAFYYQVYGAQSDLQTGKPRLDVSYTFLAEEADRLVEVGRVIFDGQEAEAHGYALPLKDWPPGAYLVRVEVEDRVASRRVSRDVLFRILGEP